MEKLIGKEYSVSIIVTEYHTAKHLGSGDMDVYATPAMIALMENAAATLLSASLSEGDSSVGVEISSSHLKASPVGAEITATAKVSEVDGRSVKFEITASDNNSVIGKATHTRFVVNRAKFLSRLEGC